MQFMPHPTKALLAPAVRQHGFVLVTALIFLMVLSVLAVMAVRGSLFDERFASSDRDTVLAQENAELALRDAERDILGLRFDGQFCAAVACPTLRPFGTRPSSAIDGNFWISGNSAIEDIGKEDGDAGQAAIATKGIYSYSASAACGMPIWSGANWVDGVAPPRTCAGTLGIPVPTIPYGTFTQAPFNQPGVRLPRYLIEFFKSSDLTIDDGTSNKILFRITAVGFGRTVGANGASTSATLQAVFSPR
jgi:Tfp pilus assembly protein PilX